MKSIAPILRQINVSIIDKQLKARRAEFKKRKDQCNNILT